MMSFGSRVPYASSVIPSVARPQRCAPVRCRPGARSCDPARTGYVLDLAAPARARIEQRASPLALEHDEDLLLGRVAVRGVHQLPGCTT